jgi:hypothetical protein
MTDAALLREFFGRRAPAVLWLVVFNNHMVHHRAQLTSYLRAAGGRVPAIYGPSADDVQHVSGHAGRPDNRSAGRRRCATRLGTPVGSSLGGGRLVGSSGRPFF